MVNTNTTTITTTTTTTNNNNSNNNNNNNNLRPPIRIPSPCDGGLLNSRGTTPNPPPNIVPTNIACVKLSGKVPREPLWTWEFHPFIVRLCSSRALGNPQC